VETASEQKQALDWQLIGDYLKIFHLEARLTELKGWYGTAG